MTLITNTNQIRLVLDNTNVKNNNYESKILKKR